jgi:adenylate cyclase
MKSRLKRILGSWGVVVGAALTVAVGLGFHATSQSLYHRFFGPGVLQKSYDLLFTQRPPMQPGDVLMVYMDDDSHERLNQRFDAPWDRKLHTRLVERLTAADVRAVVFDIIFSDPSRDPEVDRAFAQAMLASGNVVLAADTVPAGYGMELVHMKKITLPTEALRDAAAQIGSAEVNPSPDLMVRRHYHGATEDLLASLSWATATLVGAPATTNENDRFRDRWINYYGPPGTLASVSYHRALDTNATPDTVFSNKVIFVGARLFTQFAGDRKDEFTSPYSSPDQRQQFMPGVEIQATQFLNLVRGDWLGRWPVPVEQIILIVLGALLGGGLVLLGPGRAAVVAMGVALFVAVATHLWFTRSNGWFPWLVPIVQAGVALGWSLLFNSMRLYVQKRLLQQSLSLHLSPSRVQQLINQPDLLKPGAEKQEVSIMFSDIADFTKISEGMDSDDLAHMMNNYFESAIGAVHETDGTVVKLIGDAIFAVWNAPLKQADHRVRACRSALQLRDQPVSFDAGGRHSVLFTRIGLHTGVANVGNFGSATRFDYTALGENINLASRMEGLNKHLGTQVLMTGETHSAVADHFITRPLGSFQLKGFEKPVEVFELVGTPDQATATREWRDVFAQALALYKQQDFSTARMLFGQVLHLKPEDGPTKFYLGRIEDIESEKMVMEWGGHTRMFDK